MTEVIATSTALTLGTALVALALAVGLLRLLDRAAGHPWAATMEVIRESPLATGIYHGLRFVGVALLIGQLLG